MPVLAEWRPFILEDEKLIEALRHLIRVAEKAQLLLNGLADTAIDALIDEATGYQKRRAHDALQRILAAYVRSEFRAYKSKFPISFYEQIYRVMGWPFDAASTARTAYVGKLTNTLIYEQLAPGVLEDLRRKNPIDAATKRRKRKHFQFLLTCRKSSCPQADYSSHHTVESDTRRAMEVL